MPYQQALIILRDVLLRLPKSEECARIVARKNEVLARFQPVFSQANLPELNQELWRDFLRFEHNGHWTMLHLCEQLTFDHWGDFKENIKVLLDETKPIEERFNTMCSTPGCEKAITSAVLLTAYPNQYGVWNKVSEERLRALNIWPEFQWGLKIGGKYEQINSVLLRLAHDLEIDLWTLDALWWKLVEEQNAINGQEV